MVRFLTWAPLRTAPPPVSRLFGSPQRRTRSPLVAGSTCPGLPRVLRLRQLFVVPAGATLRAGRGRPVLRPGRGISRVPVAAGRGVLLARRSGFSPVRRGRSFVPPPPLASCVVFPSFPGPPSPSSFPLCPPLFLLRPLEPRTHLEDVGYRLDLLVRQ